MKQNYDLKIKSLKVSQLNESSFSLGGIEVTLSNDHKFVSHEGQEAKRQYEMPISKCDAQWITI